MAITDRLAETLGIIATMRRAGVIAPMRPDKYVRIAAAMQPHLFVTGGVSVRAAGLGDLAGALGAAAAAGALVSPA